MKSPLTVPRAAWISVSSDPGEGLATETSKRTSFPIHWLTSLLRCPARAVAFALALLPLAAFAQPATVPVYRWHSAAREDNALSISWTPGSPTAAAYGYTLVREEGRIFSPNAPQPLDTVPLHIWYSPERGDFFSSTEPVWRGGPGQKRSPDYEWQMLQGYVFDKPVAGTVPVYHWFNNSLGDNLETSDPRWEAVGAPLRDGYEMGNIQGYMYPPSTPQMPETAERFRSGAMAPAGSSQLVGERPAVMFMLNYTDYPFRHTTAFFDNWLFGPGFPNARDYMLENSEFLFSWKRGAVIQINVPDDPDTTGNESLWRDNWDVTREDLLWLGFTAPGGQRFSAVNAGGPGNKVEASARDYDVWEQLALVDLSGGHLMSGDVVAFKTVGDFFLRENVGLLYADASDFASSKARFVILKAVGGQIRAGDQVTLKCVSNGRYLQAVGGGGSDITTTATAPGANGLFTLNRGFPVKGSLVRRAAREAARLGQFNPATYDRDGDGHLTSAEVTVVELESSPASLTDGCAQTSAAGSFTVPGSTVSVDLASVSASGEDVSFATLVHEMTHQLQAWPVDLYGPCGLSLNLTLMGATCGESVPANSRDIYNLDPWHRMMFGWTKPLIRMVNQPAVSDQLTSLDVVALSDKRPVLLYDPMRYDLGNRQGEYLLIEYRTRSYSAVGYDHNVAGEGLAIWYVKTRGGGSLDVVPSQCSPGSTDPACFSLGAPDSAHGNSTLWTAANGRFTVRWADGTIVPVTFEIAPGPFTKPTLDMELSPAEGFVPRLDSASQAANPYSYILSLTGMFPIRQTGADSVRLVAGGTTITCPIRSWNLRQIQVQVPHGTPAGDYQLEVWNDGVRGNRLAWHLASAVNTPPGVFQFGASAFSVSESAGAAVITVNRTGGSSGTVSVRCAVSDETARAGTDYFVPFNTTLTFFEGETSKTLTIRITNDALDEDDELVRLTLLSPTGGATLTGINPEWLRIFDEEPMPVMSIGDVSVVESDNASVNAVFTVTLSTASGRTVVANYSTRDGTAIVGSDYAASSSSQVIFAPGQTTQQIVVPVLPDRLNENDETFLVDLTYSTTATFGDATGQAQIVDNDSLPTLSVGALVVTEDSEGTLSPTFRVRLSAPSELAVQFFAFTADGTAHSGEDYTGVSGLVTIPPGETEALVQTHVTGTPGEEPDEVLYLRLSSPVNAVLPAGDATLTIKQLQMLSIRREGDDSVLTFPTGNIGQRYHVERSESLSPTAAAWTWLTPPEGIPGTGEVGTFRDVGATGATGFYRVFQTGP